MASSTLTTKGQVTIPKEVRDSLGLRTGDRLFFHLEGDGSVRVTPESIDLLELGGALRPRVRGITLEAMKRAIRKGASGR
jgi:AbrB family looped-hinge helix DNA binding protein